MPRWEELLYGALRGAQPYLERLILQPYEEEQARKQAISALRDYITKRQLEEGIVKVRETIPVETLEPPARPEIVPSILRLPKSKEEELVPPVISPTPLFEFLGRDRLDLPMPSPEPFTLERYYEEARVPTIRHKEIVREITPAEQMDYISAIARGEPLDRYVLDIASARQKQYETVTITPTEEQAKVINEIGLGLNARAGVPITLPRSTYNAMVNLANRRIIERKKQELQNERQKLLAQKIEQLTPRDVLNHWTKLITMYRDWTLTDEDRAEIARMIEEWRPIYERVREQAPKVRRERPEEKLRNPYYNQYPDAFFEDGVWKVIRGGRKYIIREVE